MGSVAFVDREVCSADAKNEMEGEEPESVDELSADQDLASGQKRKTSQESESAPGTMEAQAASAFQMIGNDAERPSDHEEAQPEWMTLAHWRPNSINVSVKNSIATKNTQRPVFTLKDFRPTNPQWVGGPPQKRKPAS